MIFKYDKQINRKAWESITIHETMFGMKFPDKISIAQQDEEMAKKKIPEFFALWDKDKELRKTIFKIYGYKLPEVLECYIVTAKTSAANLEKKNILVSMHAPANKVPTVIIHEFSHVAFFKKWSNFCKKLGYTNKGIQELKEVITIINNIEFKNIEDKGYFVHADIRNIVKEMWTKGKNLLDIISDPAIIKLTNSLNTIKEK